jgi:hypothetical protein
MDSSGRMAHQTKEEGWGEKLERTPLASDGIVRQWRRRRRLGQKEGRDGYRTDDVRWEEYGQGSIERNERGTCRWSSA